MPFEGSMLKQRRRQRPPPPETTPPSSSLTIIISRSSFPFLLSFLLAATGPAAAQTSPASQLDNATDLAALRAFMSLADPTGNLTASWVSTNFCSNWHGVACGPRQQRVTQLSLPGASLAGSIPPHIGNLSFLVYLNLSRNQFTGPLPAAALARLSRLRYLDLSSNYLTGSVPAELGGLSNLQSLILETNKLTGGIPGAIWRMASLRQLVLSDNTLSGEIPQDLRLPNVTELSLSRNELSGRIPPALGRLFTLRILQLNRNLGIIGQIPAELGDLSQLRNLRLGVTNLTGKIPPALGNLTNLESLTIVSAKIEGEIPIELGKLAKLKVLNLAENELDGGFPIAVYNMSSLQDLVLAFNNLQGPLPSDLGRRLPRTLRNLYINVNSFKGTIPSSLSNSSMISTLELSYNRFEGSVPPELGALQELTHLTVANNTLSGSLDFLGALTNCRKLQQLNLLDNAFSGTFPASAVANFTNTDLYRFVAQGNRVTGSIPASFGNLTNMQTLVLSYNMLSGKIPPTMAALPNLQRLYLEVNRLEGPIPEQIGSAKSLGLLFLQVNILSGPIPDSICNLTALHQLDLGQNGLESAVPQGLWRLTALVTLNLAQNRLEGQLPDTMGRLANLTSLDFSINHFSGGIPFTIGKLQMLEDFSLANNDLSGPLPSSLGSLTGLKMLDLSSNSLSGDIPPSIAQLQSLEHLNLSFNKLEGQVPKDGIFKNASPGISNGSFAGNLALCGAPWFGLPTCKEARRKRGRHKFIVIASVAAALGFLVMVLLAFFVLAHRRKKNKKRNAPDPLSKEDMAGYALISRHELAIATDGFSEANLIGAGSFGKVYRGRLDDGTLVAVKVLDLQMGETAWRSFDAECRVMRTVRHRNLVGIITTCSNLDFRAFVLPLMPNGSLDRWIHPDDGDGPRLNLHQRVEVATDVATALEYLHHGCSEPVVHCDLKPSNVLLDSEMVAHIADFGIAKVMVEHSRTATTTSTPGTFGYMAPEYGTAGRVTTKGDVYSYGILLLETFTGKGPTDARFAGDLSLRRWVASAFPNAVAGVVDDCLLRDPPEESSSGSIDSSTILYGSSGISSISSSSRGLVNAGRSAVGEESKEREEQRLRCLVAVLELGLICSSDSLKERPDMAEVAAKLKKILGSLEW